MLRYRDMTNTDQLQLLLLAAAAIDKMRPSLIGREGVWTIGLSNARMCRKTHSASVLEHDEYPVIVVYGEGERPTELPIRIEEFPVIFVQANRPQDWQHRPRIWGDSHPVEE